MEQNLETAKAEETTVVAQPSANPFAQEAWVETPVSAEEIKPTSETVKQEELKPEIKKVEETKKEETPTPSFDPNPYLKEKFSFENEDAAQAAFNEWKSLKENAGKSQLEFANETSQKFFEYLKEGKEDDVFNFLQKKRELASVESMNAADGLKTQLKYSNPHFTKQDIEDVFEEKYALPNKPVIKDDETDEEYAERVSSWEETKSKVERRVERDWKVAKDELSKLNGELVLPDIAKPISEEEQKQKAIAEALPKLREAYAKELEENYKNFNGYNVTFKNKDVEIPIAFTPTEEEKTALKQEFEDFDQAEYFGNRWFAQDGTPNIVKSMEDRYLLENRDKIFQKIADDAVGKYHEWMIANQKNISVAGNTPQGYFKPNGDSNKEMADHFWNN